VYLIGAGPGDPGLLTLRGLACLRMADVIIHDTIVARALLAHARAGAEVIDVGSVAPPPMAQEAISHLMVEQARDGKTVARLKWGDPFVFGRGGAEALFLHEHGIPFEVVPGVPAAIGAPAYAGIPISYPGGGNTITFVRAYGETDSAPSDVDWTSVSKLDGTIVCYAGAQQLPRIIDTLRAKGWPDQARGAVIYDGTTSRQETLEDTLAGLAARLREHPRRHPAILVLGRVVGFREHLRWFDVRPLFGRRVLVTRPRGQAHELVSRLALLGAEPVEAPLIRIDPPEDPEPLTRAAAAAGTFDAIVFTSANAVESFMGALLDGGRDVRAVAGPLLCAVGRGTADRLAQYGITADLVPDEFRADALLEALFEGGIGRAARVLLPRADIGREVIGEGLRQAGATVTDVIAYRTVLDESAREGGEPDVYRLLLDGQIDVVTFTSASAVTNFTTVFGPDQAADLLAHTTIAAIGPVTADAVRNLGLTVGIQPATATVAALADAIAAYYGGR
jgi:uroporphyrinogen III methyltransferase/synthase